MNAPETTLKKAIFWTTLNVVLIFAFMALLWICIDIFLRKYTDHLNNIIVPDLLNMKIDSATSVCKALDLNPLIYDSIYVEESKSGVVVHQTPAPGTPTKKNRTIYLIIGRREKEKIPVDSLIGGSLRNALLQLSVLKVKIDTVIYMPNPCNDCVLGIIYEGRESRTGDLIPAGATVSLIIGKMDTTTSVVPDLTGKPLPLALSIIRDSLFFTASIISLDEDSSIIDSASYGVISQRPSAGSHVPAGSFIDLFVSKKFIKDTTQSK